MHLAGDINAKVVTGGTVEELMAGIREQMRGLEPGLLSQIIDLEAIREPQGSSTERGLTRSGA